MHLSAEETRVDVENNQHPINKQYKHDVLFIIDTLSRFNLFIKFGKLCARYSRGYHSSL